MKSLNLAKPHLIVVVGIPGSGKTFFARQFADMFGAPFVHDEELTDIVADAASVAKLRTIMLENLLRSKQTVVVEGVGSTRTDRQALSSFAHKHGYQPLYIWVQTEPTTAQARATKGIGKQIPSHPLSEAEFKQIASKFQPLARTDPMIVISGKHTYASQAKNVLKKLTEPRAGQTKIDSSPLRPEQPDHVSSPRRGRITIN